MIEKVFQIEKVSQKRWFLTQDRYAPRCARLDERLERHSWRILTTVMIGSESNELVRLAADDPVVERRRNWPSDEGAGEGAAVTDLVAWRTHPSEARL